MNPLTRQDIVAALGPVEDQLVVEILATGASSEEFAEARTWLADDDAPINRGAPLASGRIAQVIDILESLEAGALEDGEGPGPP